MTKPKQSRTEAKIRNTLEGRPMNEARPREFWVWANPTIETQTRSRYDAWNERPPSLSKSEPVIHVVEYEAYAKALKEIARLKESMTQAQSGKVICEDCGCPLLKF